MNRLLRKVGAVFALLTAFSLSAFAQLGVDVNGPTGPGIGNSSTLLSPFSTTWEDGKHQYLYLGSELSAAGALPGLLDSIGFYVTSVGSPDPSNMSIKIKTTTATDMSAFDAGTFTTVYTTAVHTPTVGLNSFKATASFTWDGVSNIVVEVCYDNTAWSSGSGVRASTFTNPRTYYLYKDGDVGCTMDPSTASINAGSINDRPDLRIAFLPLTGRDARLAALVAPVSLVVGANPITVRVANVAADPITSVNLSYSVNGGTPVTVTGVVPPAPLTSGQTFDYTFTAPLNVATAGAYTITTWLSNANGLGADNNTSNDTLVRARCTGLSGTYTIGATGNFPSVQAAVNDLLNCGTTGAVTFQIQPGTYYGSYNLSNNPSLSANSITFTSSTSNASDVILIHDTASAAANKNIFTITGIQQVSFSALTFRRTQNAASGAFHMIRYNNEANFANVTNCVFDDQTPLSSTSFNNYGVYLDNSDNASIVGNNFNGFYYTIYLTGPSANSAYEWNNIISANTITNYRYGIYVINQGSIEIANNTVNGLSSASTFGYGIYLSRVTGINVKDNAITGLLGNAGIYIFNVNDSVGLNNNLINNVVSGPTFAATSTFSAFYGIYVGASFSATATNPVNPRDKVSILNNSVHLGINGVAGNTTTSAALFLTGGSNTTPAWSQAVVTNNMLVAYQPTGGNSFANLRSMFFGNDSLVNVLNSNYNNLYLFNEASSTALSNPLVRLNATDYNTVADWTAAFGDDANSISRNPGFSSPTLPIPTAFLSNNLGTPLALVPNDITGAVRNATTPDIGAYEFTPSPFDLGVTAVLSNSLCPDSNQTVRVTVKNVGFQTFNFATNNTILNLTVNGPIPQSYSITINTDSLRVDSSRTYLVSSVVNFSTPGTYNLVADVVPPGDGNGLNNSGNRSLSFPTSVTLPWAQDFTGLTGLPAGWVSNMAINTTAGFNQTPGLRYNVYATNASNVVLPLAGPIPGPGYLLEFAYKITNWSGWSWPGVASTLGAGDTIKLEISTDCGLNYQTVSTITAVNHVSSNSYSFFRLPLTAFAGQRIYARVAFRQSSGIDVFFDLDNFRIFLPPPVDLSVNRIIRPNNGCGLTNDTVRVEVINFGTAAQSAVPLSYTINGGAPVNGTLAGPINPGDTVIYTFPTLANLSTPGAYVIRAYPSQPNDADFTNDTSRKTVNNIPVISTFPYVQGWENGNGGWVAGGESSTWALGTPTTAGGVAAAYNGSNAWLTNLTGNYNPSERSFIESPCFDLSSLSNVRVRLGVFWETEGAYDGLNMQYSLDGGQTWLVAGALGAGVNWYNRANTVSNPNQPQWANTGAAGTGSGGWLPAEIILPQLANQANVRFRFYFSSDPSIQYAGVGVDSFVVDLPTDPVITSVTTATDSCINASRTINTSITRFRGLTSVNLHYNITGTGAFVAVPMTRIGTTNNYSGTIPVSAPAVRNRYFVSVVDSLGLTDTSGIQSYVDNYLGVDVFPGTRTVALGDTVILRATPRGIANVKITEVVQFRTGTGQTPAYPAYATGQDMVEISNLGNGQADLSGFSFEVEGGGARTYTFPQGATIPGNGIMILHLGTGVDDPANSYYNSGGGNDAISSASQSSFILKNLVGNVVDVVAVNGFTPVNVPSGQWAGSIPSSSGRAGVIRRNSDTNNASDWVIAGATDTMSVGAVNNPMIISSPVGGVSWNTTPVTNADTLVVGPFTTTGTFTYIATVSDGRCNSSDTAIITVGAIVPDIGVSGFANLTAGSNHNGSTPVQIRAVVRNFGPMPATGFDVEYRVNGGSAIVTNSVTRTLQPGDTIHHTFSVAWTPTVAGPMRICANTTGMPGEINRANDTVCINVNSTVSVEELVVNDRLIGRVYPNPASDVVNFEFNEFAGKGVLEIVDQLGRIVARTDLNRANQDVYQLQTETWSAGMYTYRLIANDQLQFGKVVIRK